MLERRRSVFEGAARRCAQTDFADACPIGDGVALEVASTNEPLRVATAEVFQSADSWWLSGDFQLSGICRAQRARGWRSRCSRSWRARSC